MREKFDRQLDAYYDDLTLPKEKEDDDSMLDFENSRTRLASKSYSQTDVSENIAKLEQLTENLEKVDQLNLPTIEMMLHLAQHSISDLKDL